MEDISPTCGWAVHIPSCASPIDSNGNVITKLDYVGFYNRNFSQKVDQYRIVNNEEV